ncbi:uncharacterized protein PG986_013123 [Apiospora aurea]|uniref:Uncharacterized protein n=1 Tax=Apiospora aurea TaxID=335848 RepID=A0ABR1PUP6_9PEZI
MDTAQASKRKRELVDGDADDGNASDVQTHERASGKRACRVIKEEPDEVRGVLLSRPEHPQDNSPVKEKDSVKKEEEPETGRNSLVTPPPSQPESPPSPPPKYWHPAFPDRAVRCRYCQRTDKVLRVPAARSNTFNGGRVQFTCTVGQCSFYSGTDVKLADKADLELAVSRMVIRGSI